MKTDRIKKNRQRIPEIERTPGEYNRGYRTRHKRTEGAGSRGQPNKTNCKLFGDKDCWQTVVGCKI